MRGFGPAFMLALSLAMPFSASADDGASKSLAARIELHAIRTLTLSDQQFLTGDANAKPATLTGEFRIAQGSGQLPVVVLVHGSGGMGPNIAMWANELNAMGISTF